MDEALGGMCWLSICLFNCLHSLLTVNYSDREDLKARLSRDSGQSFVCPNRAGCTISVSLRSGHRPDEKSSSLVITAIRILVGSSFGGIPSRVVIHGRPLNLMPRTKKWYCIPLTKEEIALGVRCGFVAVSIERAIDPSSSIVVDAMEVYGIERELMEHWLPKSYTYTDPSAVHHSPISSQQEEVNGDESFESAGLIHSCQALSGLCKVSEGRRNALVSGRDFLRELVEETALESCKKLQESVQNLVKNFEPDSRSRISFLDECILLGCSRSVAKCKTALDALAMDSDNDDLEVERDNRRQAIGSLIRDTLQTASRIAKERPMNYLKSIENAIESDLSSDSLAVEASKVLIGDFAEVEEYQDMINGPEGIIELSLIELAIELNTDSTHNEQFASFTTIQKFLDLENDVFIKRTCDAISSFCGKYGDAERQSGDRHGLFTLIQHARLVAYQCDSCSLFPMKAIRYTLLEGDHDIE